MKNDKIQLESRVIEMGLFGIILIIVACVCLVAIFYISIYNKIQLELTKIEHVEGLIDEDLRTKYDLILRADDAMKKSDIKKDYFKEYRKLKEEKISNFDLERKLKEAEMMIHNLYHDNPELSLNENMDEVMRDFKIVNEKLIAGISYYNKKTNLFNAYIRKFPNNFIAKIHHISIKTFFDTKDMTDTDINDFKL